MSLSDFWIIFFTNFFMVFLLGVQSKNVNNSDHFAASITTVLILSAQVTFIHYVKDMTTSVFLVSAIGSMFGINASIVFYDHVIKKRKN